MMKKVTAYFLLALFWLVILFPGYGRAAVKNQQEKSFILDEDKEPSFLGIIKGCLATGINNIVEEERSEEEDECGVSETGNCNYLASFSVNVLCFFSFSLFFPDHDHMYDIHFKDIISPPPDSFQGLI